MTPAQDQVLDEYQRPVPGATIYVFKMDGTDAVLTSDGTAPLAQPLTADDFGNYSYWADDGAYREDIWFGGKKRFSQVVVVGSPAGDLLLRGDLAATTGADLIGTDDGTVGDIMRATPRRLSLGPRVPLRTDRQCRDRLNGTNGATALHLDVVGYAAHPNAGGAAVTGGFGKTEYYVNSPSWDSTTQYTFGWALAQAKANGGGLIRIDPRGPFDLRVTDAVSFRLDDGNDNITIFAGGLNATVWTDSLAGSVFLRGANCIFYGLTFRTMPGLMSGDLAGAGVKSEIGLVTIGPEYCDKIAFINCEMRHASDGAADCASTGFSAASSECNITYQNCIIWDTDEAQLAGAISDTSASGDVRKMFVTHYNTVFAYCGQRQPKALGNAMVHCVDCYWLLKPFDRDQPSPVLSPGACAGAQVQNGGWLLVESGYFQAADGVGGYNATELVANPTSGATGYINVSGCVADDGLQFQTAGVVAHPGYTLTPTPIPADAAGRKAWIADRWAKAGARPDAAPDGLWVFVPGSTAAANGDTVWLEHGRAGRWVRIDSRTEYLQLPATTSVQTVTTAASIQPAFTNDQVNVTALAAALNLNNPSGTPVRGKHIRIRIKDNGTARSLNYGSQYRAVGVTLPTATTPNKTLYLTATWNDTDTKLDIIDVKQEA